VCCETNEARRLVKKALSAAKKSTTVQRDENDLDFVFTKFGIGGVVCNGRLVLMARPTANTDDGTQPFSGRLGKLRYLGLAVVAAAGAVAADLVQLVLPFPLEGRGTQSATALGPDRPHRSPIVYPILYGHVLTHVVAAICASSGRARARSDALEIVWPVPFSSRGSFVCSEPKQTVGSVVDDSEGFMKLGLLARILQVLLATLDIRSLDSVKYVEKEEFVCRTLRQIKTSTNSSTPEGEWRIVCSTLLDMSLCLNSDSSGISDEAYPEGLIAKRFDEGCALAIEAAWSYLAEIGTILQVLLPGVMTRYCSGDIATTYESMQTGTSRATLDKLRSFFRFEPILEMLQSDAVRSIVSGWYSDARRHDEAAALPSDAVLASGAAVCSRLYRTQGFRALDWPMESCQGIGVTTSAVGKNELSMTPGGSNLRDDVVDPMDIDSIAPAGILASSSEMKASNVARLVTFGIKKSVPLIGGYPYERAVGSAGPPRIARIPTSYTDLYAELGQLLPDSEQTAVCLICGEVLNAGGKGECTKHSFKCGAGTGMFFLLQECAGLIMHNGKAAYIHSPYVDSHGETPQYRGRPLNLDLDRYDHLREVWSGHAIRQQVVAERGGSRQVIVPDFY
jgi:Proteolysis_6 C-terminal